MRSALITGASTGIGRSSALRLDAEGWRVFAGVRREEDAEALSASASEHLVPLMLDVTNQAQISVAVARVEEAVGDQGLDGLVNNAGIIVTGPLETMPIEAVRNQLEVNLTAQVAVVQAFMPSIRKAKGRIVFVSSLGARMALPFMAPYHASKQGLESIADSLRRELRPWKIKVALIEPGPIETPIWQRGEELAEEIASEASQDQELLYGKRIDRFWEMGKKHLEARAIPPQRVAKAISHALSASRPKLRYPVGLPARGAAAFYPLVPDRALDWALGLSLRG